MKITLYLWQAGEAGGQNTLLVGQFSARFKHHEDNTCALGKKMKTSVLYPTVLMFNVTASITLNIFLSTS